MAAATNKNAGCTPATGLFTTTHWSIVRRAQDDSQTAMSTLFERYRSPLLIWLQLRARQYAPLEPEDLVQGFCAHLLSRKFLANVRQEKGKFRTFLLTSLQRYAKDELEKERARKRGGGQPPISLQETDGQGQPLHDPAASDAGPDREFDLIWARNLLANALRQLETDCARTGHAALCVALESVMFADETALRYRAIAERLGMTENHVKVAAHRIRAMLRDIIREEVRETVDNEADFEEEIRYLPSLFGR